MCLHKWERTGELTEEWKTIRQTDVARKELKGHRAKYKCLKCGITAEQWKKAVNYTSEKRWVWLKDTHILGEDFK